MSHDFNLDGLLNYDDDQAVSPDTIISELGKQLEEATNGFVKGVVSNGVQGVQTRLKRKDRFESK